EAEPGDHRRQEGGRVRHRAGGRTVPAEIGILHDVLGFGDRTEHAVGEAGEAPALPLERRRGRGVGGHAACAATGWAARKPMANRFQTLITPTSRKSSTSSD